MEEITKARLHPYDTHISSPIQSSSNLNPLNPQEPQIKISVNNQHLADTNLAASNPNPLAETAKILEKSLEDFNKGNEQKNKLKKSHKKKIRVSPSRIKSPNISASTTPDDTPNTTPKIQRRQKNSVNTDIPRKSPYFDLGTVVEQATDVSPQPQRKKELSEKVASALYMSSSSDLKSYEHTIGCDPVIFLPAPVNKPAVLERSQSADISSFFQRSTTAKTEKSTNDREIKRSNSLFSANRNHNRPRSSSLSNPDHPIPPKDRKRSLSTRLTSFLTGGKPLLPFIEWIDPELNITQLHQEIVSLRKELLSSKKEIEQSKNENVNISNENNLLSEENQRVYKIIEEIKETEVRLNGINKELEEKIEVQKKEIILLNSQNSQLQEELIEKNNVFEQLEQKDKLFQTKLNEQLDKIDSLEKENKRLMAESKKNILNQSGIKLSSNSDSEDDLDKNNKKLIRKNSVSDLSGSLSSSYSFIAYKSPRRERAFSTDSKSSSVNSFRPTVHIKNHDTQNQRTILNLTLAKMKSDAHAAKAFRTTTLWELLQFKIKKNQVLNLKFEDENFLSAKTQFLNIISSVDNILSEPNTYLRAYIKHVDSSWNFWKHNASGTSHAQNNYIRWHNDALNKISEKILNNLLENNKNIGNPINNDSVSILESMLETEIAEHSVALVANDNFSGNERHSWSNYAVEYLKNKYNIDMNTWSIKLKPEYKLNQSIVPRKSVSEINETISRQPVHTHIQRESLKKFRKDCKSWFKLIISGRPKTSVRNNPLRPQGIWQTA